MLFITLAQKKRGLDGEHIEHLWITKEIGIYILACLTIISCYKYITYNCI